MKKQIIAMSLLVVTTLAIQTGCKKETDTADDTSLSSANYSETERGQVTHKYNSDVAKEWMKMHLRIMKTTTGISNVAYVRPFAYSGIALYEAVVPGMPVNKSLSGQLSALPPMPSTNCHLEYHWACSANAAEASILKKMYPTTSVANIASIDSLENAFTTQFGLTSDPATITRSVAFGRDVAQAIFDWSQTDGSANAFNPYIPPVGPGLWVPTPPAFNPTPLAPYWGAMRAMVPGSGNNAQPPAPTPYSEVPGSPFYLMAQHVYDVSQTLTADQTAQGMFWRDLPGPSTPGHYLSILEQVIEIRNSPLDKAALAAALCGIMDFDASISCWQTKYANNLVRPVTYIRNVLGYTAWNPLLGTPGHPEYSSAHAVLSAAHAKALSSLYGNHFAFTDHTNDYLGQLPRSFTSFDNFAADAANSRVFAGIHYQPSCDVGIVQGNTVAQNILNTVDFRK